jgi:hypothetical protein
MTLRLTLSGLLLLLLQTFALAQTSTIKGTIVDSLNRGPIPHANIILKGTVIRGQSEPDGTFTIQNVPYGNYLLDIQMEGYDGPTGFEIKVDKALTDIGPIGMRYSIANLQTIVDAPVVTMTESELNEESSQNVSGILTASRDPYMSASMFNFSNARFRNRGYDNENVTFINGVPVEDLTNSRTVFGSWSGLNDVLRSREFTYGLNPGGYAFGGLDGAMSIDAKASNQRRQFQIGYAISNRSYDNRIMSTIGTGLLKGGWSFSASISRRWADEGYVEGTFYDSWSWYVSAEKRFNAEHSISLTQFGTNTTNGRSTSTVQEVYDLTGTNFYNSLWGYQDGKKRNSSVARQQQPLTILSHEWKTSNKSILETSIAYQSGTTSVTGLDWYNAPDPRPDFYRKLPSYINDPAAANEVADRWRNDVNFRQIDWTGMYNANRNNVETITNVGGIAGNNVTGLRSRYIVENRMIDNQRFVFSMVDNTTLSDHVVLTSGFLYQNQNSRYYKRVDDLLGGEFYVDLNQFADLDYPDSIETAQNDLNNPNRVLGVGDKFGYDYKAVVNKTSAWLQGQFKYDHFDFFGALQISETRFKRIGYTRTGLFADNSLGESAEEKFTNFSGKGGVTYKLDGRNYFLINALYETRAPLFENVYVSPRTRATTIADPENEKIFSVEAGYLLRAPKLKIRATMYYSQLNDGTNTINFYHEEFRTFVNYTLTNIDRRHIGLEAGADANIGRGFSIVSALSLGQYYYTSRQNGTITADNTSEVLADNQTIYSENFFVANGPQTAVTAGLNYRSKKFWFVNVNLNYFGNIYIDFNPARRSVAGVAPVNDSDPRWQPIIDQEKADGQMTLDLFGGYSWKVNNKFDKLKNNTFLVFTAGITNLLNNQDLITGGFEQLRFDFAEKNPDKFAPRYFYGFGTTFFFNVTLRFN